jgi:cell wall-associated NlpC family hydrolase
VVPALLLSLAFGLQGCGGLPWREEAAETLPEPGHETTTALLVRAALLAQLRAWKGVPYRLGGHDRRGLDCSAFAQITYRERFGIDIPRETAAQRTAGIEVALPEVAPGDLLFFDTGRRVQHVGIYAGRRQFLHVSTQAGVMLSSVLDPYWSTRLRAAIRVAVP